MTDTITIILATGNRDKVKELRPLLEHISPIITVVTLPELGVSVDVEETEETLEGNALLKARAIFSLLENRFPFLIALADDTGLEVAALDGAPGVYSARYAPTADGTAPTYSDNVNHLLKNMEGKEERSACFRSVIALKGRIPMGDSKAFAFEQTAAGEVHGSITQEPFGDGGFGYDPVFYVEATSKTYAQMSIAEKNSMSHRARAVQQAITKLRTLFAEHHLPLTPSMEQA